MPSSVSFFQLSVVVHLPALPFDPTLDMFLLCTCCKWVVPIVMQVPLKVTMSVMCPWLSKGFTQRSTGATECFYLWQSRWRWSRARVCDVVSLLEVSKWVNIFNCIFVTIEFKMLSGFHKLERNIYMQMHPVWNKIVFRIVYLDRYMSAAA